MLATLQTLLATQMPPRPRHLYFGTSPRLFDPRLPFLYTLRRCLTLHRSAGHRLRSWPPTAPVPGLIFTPPSLDSLTQYPVRHLHAGLRITAGIRISAPAKLRPDHLQDLIIRVSSTTSDTHWNARNYSLTATRHQYRTATHFCGTASSP